MDINQNTRFNNERIKLVLQYDFCFSLTSTKCHILTLTLCTNVDRCTPTKVNINLINFNLFISSSVRKSRTTSECRS